MRKPHRTTTPTIKAPTPKVSQSPANPKVSPIARLGKYAHPAKRRK